MQLKKINQDHYVVVNENWRITHSTQPLDQVNQPQGETSLGMFMMGKSKVQHLDLSYIKSLVGEVDVEKIAEEWGDNYRSFKAGYQHCLSDNKDKRFSEEDMRKAIEMGRLKQEYKFDGRPTEYKYNTDEIISSLTQPKDTWEVEFDENNNLKLK